MLTIELHKLVTGEKENIGPRVIFRLSRNILEADGVMVAVYSAGLWRTTSNCFLVLSVGTDVHIGFSSETDKSIRYGPFNRLFVVDGLVHAGEREGTILARFEDQTGHWLSYADNRRWRDIDITAKLASDTTAAT